MIRRFAVACSLICAASTALAQPPPIRLQPLSQGEIVSPVGITHAGDGSQRLFVTDQRGKIHILDQGLLAPTPFLDIGAKLVTERAGFDERGLLGLAFHPQFGQPGAVGGDKFYVYYSAPSDDAGTPDNPIDHRSVVAEYAVSADPNIADPASERILLTIDQPQFNHNAGYLGFGPDGLLYVTTGDGGGGGDDEPGHTGGGSGNPPGGLGNAQDLGKLLGKVLRIDVNGSDGPGGQYGIPADNPFVDEPGARPEIFAYGLRNPWRATFDGDRLIVADVGQGLVEEVNLVEAGGNYGWRIKEGTLDFDASVAPQPPATLIDPIAQYTRNNDAGAATGLKQIGISVTGGVVYRGSDFPQLDGTYLFGDFSTAFAPANGTLLALTPEMLSNSAASPAAPLTLDVAGGNPIGEYVLAFGLDEQGEAYVATKRALAPSGLVDGQPTGTIYRIVAVPEPAAWTWAAAAVAGMGLRRRVRQARRRPPTTWRRNLLTAARSMNPAAAPPVGKSRRRNASGGSLAAPPSIGAALLAAVAFAAAGAAQAAPLVVEDFASGLGGWNSGGSTVALQPTGGPLGDDDAFLRASTNGNLAIRNTTADWTGDWHARGVATAAVDLNAFY
jgi:glucose/arabinose dehydrogenase